MAPTSSRDPDCRWVGGKPLPVVGRLGCHWESDSVFQCSLVLKYRVSPRPPPGINEAVVTSFGEVGVVAIIAAAVIRPDRIGFDIAIAQVIRPHGATGAFFAKSGPSYEVIEAGGVAEICTIGKVVVVTVQLPESQLFVVAELHNDSADSTVSTNG